MPVDRNDVRIAQARLLINGFGDQVETDPPNWPDVPEGEDRGVAPRAIFRRNRIVVRDPYLDRALDALARVYDRDRVVFELAEQDLVAGVGQVALPGDIDTLGAVRRLRAALGRRVVAVDHLLSITPIGSRCPATEPQFAPELARPWPPVSSGGSDGAGVRVGVIDTGLFEHAPAEHPWLAGVTGELEPEVDENGVVPHYAGHGTFIAGVIRSMAPRAEVHVLRTLKAGDDAAGGAFESEIAHRIQDLLVAGCDVVSLSAGSYAELESQDMLILRGVVEQVLPLHKGSVLVAAAGNDSLSDPFLPAAMRGVVSVGALSVRGDDLAWFSNHGGWVDVYALGEDLVNAFAHGTYAYTEPPDDGTRTQDFAGMARWSGTSFSTPLVAGLVAARMSVTGENGATAAHHLLELARAQAIPGVGAVLRPGDADVRRWHHGHHGHHGCGCRVAVRSGLLSGSLGQSRRLLAG